jgi:hypothetical protein
MPVEETGPYGPDPQEPAVARVEQGPAPGREDGAELEGAGAILGPR